MSTITPDRIIELWPTLSPETRQLIADIVESNAGRAQPLELSDEEEQLLAQAHDDFEHGRTLDTDEYRTEMSVFMRRLAEQSTS